MSANKSITVIYNGISKVVLVNPAWNVLFLKQLCKEFFRISPTVALQALVGGKFLLDMTRLDTIDLHQLTTIHLVISPSTMPQVLFDSDSNADSVNSTFRFHVFCSTCEGSIRHAKLRVICDKCHSQTFWLTDSPNNFQELSGNGICCRNAFSDSSSSERCDGTTCHVRLDCVYQTTNEKHDCFPLWLVSDNFCDLECLGCREVTTPVMLFPCLPPNSASSSSHTPQHALCIPCFLNYCSANLGAAGKFIIHPEFGFTIGCPVGCADSFIPDPHYFKICGSQFYQRYKDVAAELVATQDGAVYCPNPHCGQVWIPEPDAVDSYKMTCSIRNGQVGCGLVFCKLCKLPYHGENPCLNAERPSFNTSSRLDLSAVWKVSEEIASKLIISKTTKSCPGCGVSTERNKGCMHMTCTHCGFEWCWICVSSWKTDCQNNHWFE